VKSEQISIVTRAEWRHCPGINLDRDSMKTVYEKFGLEPGTQDFIGHAMALYLDDE
jgi:RAB protein geranylgeranyltransferase component A